MSPSMNPVTKWVTKTKRVNRGQTETLTIVFCEGTFVRQGPTKGKAYLGFANSFTLTWSADATMSEPKWIFQGHVSASLTAPVLKALAKVLKVEVKDEPCRVVAALRAQEMVDGADGYLELPPAGEWFENLIKPAYSKQVA